MARFFRRGVSKIYFVPAVSSLSAPTSSEISAGQDLSPAVAEISGWQLSNSPIMTPALSDAYTTQISGEDTTDASTLTLYDDDTDDDIRSALAKGTTGFVILMPYGKTAAKRCEVWPVTITGFNDQWGTGNDPARSVVSFAITGVPDQDAVLPSFT